MVVSSFKNKKMSHKVSRISSATFTKFNSYIRSQNMKRKLILSSLRTRKKGSPQENAW